MYLLFKHKLVQDIYNHYRLAELKFTHSNTLAYLKKLF